MSYDPRTDPIVELLRRAAHGDEAAKAEFHAERAARAKARLELERAGRENAWAMIRRSRERRSRSVDTGETAA